MLWSDILFHEQSILYCPGLLLESNDFVDLRSAIWGGLTVVVVCGGGGLRRC